MRNTRTGTIGIAAAVLVLGIGGFVAAQGPHGGAGVVTASNGTGPDAPVPGPVRLAGAAPSGLVLGNGTGPDAIAPAAVHSNGTGPDRVVA
jgi:hypothetical protein